MKTMPPRKAAMSPKKLREILDASGKTQQEFADALDVSRVTLFRWISGQTNIDKKNAAYILLKFPPK